MKLYYPKDLLDVPGLQVRSIRSASRLHKRIREHFGRAPRRPLTRAELAEWLGVGEESLRNAP
ncbi:MAG: hypothetical protein NW241_10820 [Bacteroidia bacterium]|nr:hypothetical protein [Bacteroidia bacterium]